jgi:type IV pilus assembly protein PilV
MRRAGITRPNRHAGGSALLEALLAIVLFSIGLIALLMLLTASIREDSAARYRAQAALLVDEAVAVMWAGDRSSLASRFGANGADFTAWRARVQSQLPGAVAYPPTVQVASDNTVTLTVQWKAGADPTGPHRLLSVTRIAP